MSYNIGAVHAGCTDKEKWRKVSSLSGAGEVGKLVCVKMGTEGHGLL